MGQKCEGELNRVISEKQQAKIQALEFKNVSDFNVADWKNWRLKQDVQVLEQLCELPKNTKIYTILRRVSNSGINRVIDMFYIENNSPSIIHFGTDKIFQKRFNDGNTQGYKVGGCGMDMGFHLVSNLSYLVSKTKGIELDSYYFKQEWI